MSLHYQHPEIRRRLFDGNFGLEKESLRVDRTRGTMVTTPHPFHEEGIVQDFAENQTEINTAVYPTWQAARQAAENMCKRMLVQLKDMNEVLWPFSNPGPIVDEDNIPVMTSGGKEAREYREYLSQRYGKMKMVFSGVHYNFSFTDEILQTEMELRGQNDLRAFKNEFYLHLVQRVVRYGWLVDILLNASPLCDGSLLCSADLGKTRFTGLGSIRNSEQGYWNFFTPNFDYSSMDAYTASIEKYVDAGLLKAPRELYYPVRIKPKAEYSMEALRSLGANHIELRMIDLNPYEFSGISDDDAWFCHVFLVWLACLPYQPLSWKEQIYAQQNFKNASHYQLEHVRILLPDETSISAREAALRVLEQMKDFYAGLEELDIVEMLKRQQMKITLPMICSHAGKIRRDFADYAKDGLRHARRLQEKAIQDLDRSDPFEK